MPEVIYDIMKWELATRYNAIKMKVATRFMALLK